jgi:hypothetical protein
MHTASGNGPSGFINTANFVTSSAPINFSRSVLEFLAQVSLLLTLRSTTAMLEKTSILWIHTNVYFTERRFV